VKIKAGVQMSGIKPEMTLALQIVEPILISYGQELVITSATDSQHSKKSRHYIGYGLDLRSRDIPEEAREGVAQEMSEALGSEYYVVFEVHHFHVQFNGSPRI
jgi:conjugal transfer mating pair stabilization protein TraG